MFGRGELGRRPLVDAETSSVSCRSLEVALICVHGSRPRVIRDIEAMGNYGKNLQVPSLLLSPRERSDVAAVVLAATVNL